MSHIAKEALDRGRGDFGALSDGPAVADVWIDGRLGLVLMAHRRNDGLVADELYHAVREDDGQWSDCDHLSGGIAGVDLESPEAVASALGGSAMEIVSESASLVFTGRTNNRDDEDEDGGLELIRILEVLVDDSVDVIEIEHLSASSQPPAPRLREVTSPLVLVVLLPGQHVRVSAARRDGASLSRLGAPREFTYPAKLD